MLTPTQPDVLAGPGHVIVVCKVPLQAGLHPRPLVLPSPPSMSIISGTAEVSMLTAVRRASASVN